VFFQLLAEELYSKQPREDRPKEYQPRQTTTAREPGVGTEAKEHQPRRTFQTEPLPAAIGAHSLAL